MPAVEDTIQEYRGTCLFDGNDLRLVVQDMNSDTVFLTFTPRPDLDRNKGFQKLGFAQKFVEKNRYSGVYVIAKSAHWYQTPELAQVEAIITGLEFYRSARRRIAYGTSMGGFAVLLCAQRLGCEQAISVAPQVSMDTAIVRFENRWPDDVRKIRFIEPDARSGIREPCRYYVIYDRFYAPDRQHIDLLLQDKAILLLDLPFSGHNLLDFATQTGLSNDFLNSFANPGQSPLKVFHAMRGLRRQTTNYYEKLYQLCLQKGKTRYCGVVARYWYAYDKTSASAFRKYARYLKETQRPEDALELARAFRDAGGEAMTADTVLRDTLYSLKRYDEALPVNANLLREQPDDYSHVYFQMTTLRRLSRNGDILAFAAEHLPRNRDRPAFLRAYAEALELGGHPGQATGMRATADRLEAAKPKSV